MRAVKQSRPMLLSSITVASQLFDEVADLWDELSTLWKSASDRIHL